MRVFIPEPIPNFDTSSLDNFEVKVLHDSRYNPFDVDGVRVSLARHLHYEEFDPAQDQVCMTGRAVTLAIMMSVLTEMYPEDNITLLIWHQNEKLYVKSTLSRKGFSDELKRLKERD